MADRILADKEARRAFLVSMAALADGADPGSGRGLVTHPVLALVSLALGLLIVGSLR